MSDKLKPEQIREFIKSFRPVELSYGDEDKEKACDIIEKLLTRTDLAPAQVGKGTKVECPKCGTIFNVMKLASIAPASPWIKITQKTMPKDEPEIIAVNNFGSTYLLKLEPERNYITQGDAKLKVYYNQIIGLCYPAYIKKYFTHYQHIHLPQEQGGGR